MGRDYVKTDTMRIKISGAALRNNGPLDDLDLDTDFTSSDDSADSDAYEREFNELLECVYDAVIITDTSGAIHKYNGRSLDLFDYTMQAFYRLNILNIISGASEQTLATIHQTLINERRIFIEGFCNRSNQTVFPADIAVSILHLHGTERLAFFIRNISSRIQTEDALREAQQELIQTAHHAGMAEVATGVLHDVGNLLNSVNVSCEMIMKVLHESSLNSMAKVNHLLASQADPGAFISDDPKGQKVPRLYGQLGDRMEKEREEMLEEAEHLKSKIQIIRDVISTQQGYAKTGLFFEEARMETLVEDALAILKSSMEQGNLNIEKNYISVPTVSVQKSKFVHIILNLLKNARDALIKVTDRPCIIRIDILSDPLDPKYACVKVTDNGEGIAEKDLELIFTHGFTTKSTGHGFGLHSCANLMTEMNGRIHAESLGKGRGASFILALPIYQGQEEGT
jgi:PAS domain S-box-containing protein